MHILNHRAVRQRYTQKLATEGIIIHRDIRTQCFADEKAVLIVLIRRRACGHQIIFGIVIQRSSRAVSFLISAGSVAVKRPAQRQSAAGSLGYGFGKPVSGIPGDGKISGRTSSLL